MQRSGGNNGNIYDLRKDLQRPRHLHKKKRPPAAPTAAMALMVSR